MGPPHKRHRVDQEERGEVEERMVPLGPKKGVQRKKEGTQERGRAAAKIKQLQSKAKYVKQYAKSSKHKAKVDEYKKALAEVKHQKCFFFDFQGGCIHNRKPAFCPFRHAPDLKMGTCKHNGTLTTWMKRGPRNSFGFITLEDGNEIFCPERALGRQSLPQKVPCQVTVRQLQAATGKGAAHEAAKVDVTSSVS